MTDKIVGPLFYNINWYCTWPLHNRSDATFKPRKEYAYADLPIRLPKVLPNRGTAPLLKMVLQ